MRHLSHHHEDETELAQLGHFSEDYGDEPIFKCQNCASKNPGYEEKEASLLTIIAAVLCLIIFRLYSFLILPLVVESTKTIIKKCVKCDHVLDKQELLSMPSLTDKILSFKCGSCAMVISRKYALVLIAILSVIWFMIPSSNTSITNPGGLDLTNVRWDQFVEDCGRKVVLSNQVRAKKSFDNKYANNIIQWEGVVHTLYSRKDIKNNPFIGYLILIKMNPSDANSEFADFQLVFSNALASKYGETLNIIEVGDVLEFKGYLRTMGDEFRFHEIEVINVHLTGKKTNINDIPMISYTGNASNMRRYKPEELGSSEPKDKPKTSETPQAPVETKTSPAKNDDDNKSQDQPKVEQTSQNNQPEPEPEKVTITEPEPEPEPVLADDQTNDQVNDQVNNDQTNDQTIDNIAEPPQDAAVDDQINQDQGGDQFVASNDQVDQAVADDQAAQASEPAAVQDADQQQVDDNVVIVDTNTDTGDVNANANV